MEKKRHNTRHAAALAAAAASSEPCASTSPSHSSSPPLTDQKSPSSSPDMTSKTDMFESFQAWALKTYGDSAKTKTVTRRKYNRILKILRGEEQTSAENSKFRFWVKAKGFKIGPPSGYSSSAKLTDQVLYIPCSKLPTSGSVDKSESTIYKKVAVVENFYDIIYGVHVEMDGRGGKHAGQKRTYKAIAEMYSFLPREAVTHFLMSCTDCQKRMHLGAEQQPKTSTGNHDNGHQPDESISSLDITAGDDTDSLHIDYSLPITTTYLKHMRSLGYSEEDALNPDREIYLLISSPLLKDRTFPYTPVVENSADSEDVESEVSEEPNTPLNPAAVGLMYDGAVKEETGIESPVTQPSAGPSRRRSAARSRNNERKHESPMQWSETISDEPINMTKAEYSGNNDHSFEQAASPCNGCSKREAASTPDNLSAGTKDDDDEDDEDDPDKIDTNKYDPERLKAFNMFVRLFVDENLDRMIPISRQPKDKIQAIIDSCARQFPEFGERARKRIRTYLKSCRRNKRTRDSTNWELGRNSQPHLTSALAEQILANACENESQNAKRMRLGLKPIAAEIEKTRAEALCSPTQESILQSSQRHGKSTQSSTLTNGTQGSPSYSSSPYRIVPNATTNGHSSPVAFANNNNGPTDLSMKKSSSTGSVDSPVKQSLNQSEVVAVKQLIAGYRESAAFLLRSADELEQLLLQQN
ncbi:nucleolar protein 4 [Trichonephila clavata]|uniref:Nucleolar protein 4 n=1 Tax=Trichonephila clavata TaxID=2740835 RepID=A0A8X6IT51_TRICU|nr:nucleolar protein 4 [Trichonephila clavata]